MLLTWIEFDGMELNGKSYPGWAEGLGWFIELVPVSIAVLGRNLEFCKYFQSETYVLFSGI